MPRVSWAVRYLDKLQWRAVTAIYLERRKKSLQMCSGYINVNNSRYTFLYLCSGCEEEEENHVLCLSGNKAFMTVHLFDTC